MPLFMDVHKMEGGVSADDVAGAHEQDLATQGKYGVSYLKYWVDEDAISLDGKPEVTVVNLGRDSDAKAIQKILDNAS